jgi:hypothetical protein
MHCGGVIDPVRDAWHVCHGYKDGLPRAMGGSDAWENLAPGHSRCNLGHARTYEIPMVAKTKRVRQNYLGGKPETPWAKRYREAKEWKKKHDNR